MELSAAIRSPGQRGTGAGGLEPEAHNPTLIGQSGHPGAADQRRSCGISYALSTCLGVERRVIERVPPHEALARRRTGESDASMETVTGV